MKAYKNYVNEETMKIDIVEFDIYNEIDFATDPITNLYDSDSNHNINKEITIKSTEKLNAKIANGDYSLIKCKYCNRYFIITETEKEWFEERDLVIPKRCPRCTKNNKKRSFSYKEQDAVILGYTDKLL